MQISFDRKSAKWIDRWSGKEQVVKACVLFLTACSQAIVAWKADFGWSMFWIPIIMTIFCIYWAAHRRNELQEEAKVLIKNAEHEWNGMEKDRKTAAGKLWRLKDDDDGMVLFDDDLTKVICFWERFCDQREKWRYDSESLNSYLIKAFIAYCSVCKKMIDKEYEKRGRFYELRAMYNSILIERPELLNLHDIGYIGKEHHSLFRSGRDIIPTVGKLIA